MAALRLAARNLGVGTLRRRPPQVTAAAVVREEQRRLIHGYLSPSPGVMASNLTSCSLLRRFSSSANGEPSSSSRRNKKHLQRFEDCLPEIEQKKEELHRMLAQLETDYPSSLRSQYARDCKKLLGMLAEQRREILIVKTPNGPSMKEAERSMIAGQLECV